MDQYDAIIEWCFQKKTTMPYWLEDHRP
jgi:hypothetical protein